MDAHLRIAGGSVATPIQTAFAQLNQSDPAIAGLYANRKLWESMEAERAESRLRQALVETVRQQREIVMSRLSGRMGVIAPIVRVVLTIGALLWFPFVQPVLAILLMTNGMIGTARDLGILVVQVMSAESLLKSAAFLIVWYLLIWSLLRWSTRSKVERLMSKWKRADGAEDSLNLTTRGMGWMEELLEPVHRARETAGGLAVRVEALRREVGEAAPRLAG